MLVAPSLPREPPDLPLPPPPDPTEPSTPEPEPQQPPPPPPPPELEGTVVEELKPSNVVVRPVVMESLQASSSAATGRQRKCSAVEEEDETAGASGSESSRRSQRLEKFTLDKIHFSLLIQFFVYLYLQAIL